MSTYIYIYIYSHTHIHIYIYCIYISIYYILYIRIFSHPKKVALLGTFVQLKQTAKGCATVGFACRGLSGAFPNRKGWEIPTHPSIFQGTELLVFVGRNAAILLVDGGTQKLRDL